jgi:hypothetical protein
MELEELQTKWTENGEEFIRIENEIKRHKLAMEKLDKRKIENYKEFEELYYHAISNNFVLDSENKTWRKCINITAIE